MIEMNRTATLTKIDRNFVIPSAAFVLKRGQIRSFRELDSPPGAGDVVYGVVQRIGEHSSLENRSGRIHLIHDGTRNIFVFGNRYAPDYYEGIVPQEMPRVVDLLARSGIVGIVRTKNSMRKDPTQIRLLGYVCSEDGTTLNTCDFPLIKPKRETKTTPRSRMVLCCGTSMNSGKSLAAAACCRALCLAGFRVKAAKVTGTASLKDILHMNDAGAHPYADFSFLGYPSTYQLPAEEVIDVFDKLDLKYANNPKNFWVVEFADGVIQRETAMLLGSESVKSRIHKLVFCANDAFGAIGGVRVLQEQFGLVPDLISGVCSSSPLHIRELGQFTHLPVVNSAEPDLDLLARMLTARKRRARPRPA